MPLASVHVGSHFESVNVGSINVGSPPQEATTLIEYALGVAPPMYLLLRLLTYGSLSTAGDMPCDMPQGMQHALRHASRHATCQA